MIYIQWNVDRLVFFRMFPVRLFLLLPGCRCPPFWWSLAGVWCCSHQTGGWTIAYTVATLPGHNYLQLTPIEFQDRGSNPVLLSQWIQKSTALTIRPRGTLKEICACAYTYVGQFSFRQDLQARSQVWIWGVLFLRKCTFFACFFKESGLFMRAFWKKSTLVRAFG